MVAENPGREEGASLGQAPLGPDLLRLHWLVHTFGTAYPRGPITHQQQRFIKTA